MYTYETYLSPVTWRYGSEQMRHVWSEAHKRRIWRRLWVALAEAQVDWGLVRPEQVADLRAHADEVDVDRSLAIEAEVKHDLMSEIHAFAELCPVGGGVIHVGATSMDIKDNAEVLLLRESLDLLLESLRSLLLDLAGQIETHAQQPCMGYTHLQPAEPTTVGYRLAQVGFDLLVDLQELERVRQGLRAKGFRGAVGTAASYAQLLHQQAAPTDDAGERLPLPAQPGVDAARALDRSIMARLGLETFPVVTQTYPRKQDWLVLNALAGLAGSLYKIAFDLRVLQSQPFGEWSEPFGQHQVGSSAMPFKRNPENAETMDSLARLLATLPRVAWDNAAHSLLERTLDDSGNRRLILPEAFLLADELLRRAQYILGGLVIHETGVARQLQAYGPFAASERLLMELVKAGADRQQMHAVIRRHSLAAWQAVAQEPSGRNPLANLLASDAEILVYLPADQVRGLLDASGYVGDAPLRARELAAQLREAVDPGQASPAA
jgi:adenylosuccinate lyase